MSKALRLIVLFGLLLFVFSFFLPPGFYNSPQERFHWSWEAIFPFDGSGESLVFVGTCLVLIYPYLWAVLAAFAFLIPGGTESAAALWGQLLCHLVGMVVLVALGLSMLLFHDDFLPRPAQWMAAVVPVCLLLTIFGAARFCRPARRVPIVTAVSLLLFAPLNFIVGYLVVLDGGASWGYFLGGAGSLIALAGNIGLLAHKTLNSFNSSNS